MRVINSHRVRPNRFGDHCHSTSRVVETLRQTDPDDCLLFGRMSRFVSLAINVLKQDEATGRYAPLIAVTCLVVHKVTRAVCPPFSCHRSNRSCSFTYALAGSLARNTAISGPQVRWAIFSISAARSLSL